MNFREFIEERYDVRGKIKDIKRDPIKEFIESDIFPYDYIDFQLGEPRKMLYFNDHNRSISVFDLISYTREDLLKTGDSALLELYDVYTSQFDFKHIFNLEELYKASQES